MHQPFIAARQVDVGDQDVEAGAVAAQVVASLPATAGGGHAVACRGQAGFAVELQQGIVFDVQDTRHRGSLGRERSGVSQVLKRHGMISNPHTTRGAALSILRRRSADGRKTTPW
jgi:hypothetical protein